MERRNFLQTMLAFGVAPAFVKVDRLMRLSRIWTPDSPQLVTDRGTFLLPLHVQCPVKVDYDSRVLTVNGRRYPMSMFSETQFRNVNFRFNGHQAKYADALEFIVGGHKTKAAYSQRSNGVYAEPYAEPIEWRLHYEIGRMVRYGTA